MSDAFKRFCESKDIFSIWDAYSEMEAELLAARKRAAQKTAENLTDAEQKNNENK